MTLREITQVARRDTRLFAELVLVNLETVEQELLDRGWLESSIACLAIDALFITLQERQT